MSVSLRPAHTVSARGGHLPPEGDGWVSVSWSEEDILRENADPDSRSWACGKGGSKDRSRQACGAYILRRKGNTAAGILPVVAAEAVAAARQGRAVECRVAGLPIPSLKQGSSVYVSSTGRFAAVASTSRISPKDLFLWDVASGVPSKVRFSEQDLNAMEQGAGWRWLCISDDGKSLVAEASSDLPGAGAVWVWSDADQAPAPLTESSSKRNNAIGSAAAGAWRSTDPGGTRARMAHQVILQAGGAGLAPHLEGEEPAPSLPVVRFHSERGRGRAASIAKVGCLDVSGAGAGAGAGGGSGVVLTVCTHEHALRPPVPSAEQEQPQWRAAAFLLPDIRAPAPVVAEWDPSGRTLAVALGAESPLLLLLGGGLEQRAEVDWMRDVVGKRRKAGKGGGGGGGGPGRVCSLAWTPGGELLAAVDESGRLALISRTGGVQTVAIDAPWGGKGGGHLPYSAWARASPDAPSEGSAPPPGSSPSVCMLPPPRALGGGGEQVLAVTDGRVIVAFCVADAAARGRGLAPARLRPSEMGAAASRVGISRSDVDVALAMCGRCGGDGHEALGVAGLLSEIISTQVAARNLTARGGGATWDVATGSRSEMTYLQRSGLAALAGGGHLHGAMWLARAVELERVMHSLPAATRLLQAAGMGQHDIEREVARAGASVWKSLALFALRWRDSGGGGGGGGGAGEAAAVQQLVQEALRRATELEGHITSPWTIEASTGGVVPSTVRSSLQGSEAVIAQAAGITNTGALPTLRLTGDGPEVLAQADMSFLEGRWEDAAMLYSSAGREGALPLLAVLVHQGDVASAEGVLEQIMGQARDALAREGHAEAACARRRAGAGAVGAESSGVFLTTESQDLGGFGGLLPSLGASTDSPKVGGRPLLRLGRAGGAWEIAAAQSAALHMGRLIGALHWRRDGDGGQGKPRAREGGHCPWALEFPSPISWRGPPEDATGEVPLAWGGDDEVRKLPVADADALQALARQFSPQTGAGLLLFGGGGGALDALRMWEDGRGEWRRGVRLAVACAGGCRGRGGGAGRLRAEFLRAADATLRGELQRAMQAAIPDGPRAVRLVLSQARGLCSSGEGSESFRSQDTAPMYAALLVEALHLLLDAASALVSSADPLPSGTGGVGTGEDALRAALGPILEAVLAGGRPHLRHAVGPPGSLDWAAEATSRPPARVSRIAAERTGGLGSTAGTVGAASLRSESTTNFSTMGVDPLEADAAAAVRAPLARAVALAFTCKCRAELASAVARHRAACAAPEAGGTDRASAAGDVLRWACAYLEANAVHPCHSPDQVQGVAVAVLSELDAPGETLAALVEARLPSGRPLKSVMPQLHRLRSRDAEQPQPPPPPPWLADVVAALEQERPSFVAEVDATLRELAEGGRRAGAAPGSDLVSAAAQALLASEGVASEEPLPLLSQCVTVPWGAASSSRPGGDIFGELSLLLVGAGEDPSALDEEHADNVRALGASRESPLLQGEFSGRPPLPPPHPAAAAPYPSPAALAAASTPSPARPRGGTRTPRSARSDRSEVSRVSWAKEEDEAVAATPESRADRKAATPSLYAGTPGSQSPGYLSTPGTMATGGNVSPPVWTLDRTPSTKAASVSSPPESSPGAPAGAASGGKAGAGGAAASGSKRTTMATTPGGKTATLARRSSLQGRLASFNMPRQTPPRRTASFPVGARRSPASSPGAPEARSPAALPAASPGSKASGSPSGGGGVALPEPSNSPVDLRLERISSGQYSAVDGSESSGVALAFTPRPGKSRPKGVPPLNIASALHKPQPDAEVRVPKAPRVVSPLGSQLSGLEDARGSGRGDDPPLEPGYSALRAQLEVLQARVVELEAAGPPAWPQAKGLDGNQLRELERGVLWGDLPPGAQPPGGDALYEEEIGAGYPYGWRERRMLAALAWEGPLVLPSELNVSSSDSSAVASSVGGDWGDRHGTWEERRPRREVGTSQGLHERSSVPRLGREVGTSQRLHERSSLLGGHGLLPVGPRHLGVGGADAGIIGTPASARGGAPLRMLRPRGAGGFYDVDGKGSYGHQKLRRPPSAAQGHRGASAPPQGCSTSDVRGEHQGGGIGGEASDVPARSAPRLMRLQTPPSDPTGGGGRLLRRKPSSASSAAPRVSAKKDERSAPDWKPAEGMRERRPRGDGQTPESSDGVRLLRAARPPAPPRDRVPEGDRAPPNPAPPAPSADVSALVAELKELREVLQLQAQAQAQAQAAGAGAGAGVGAAYATGSMPVEVGASAAAGDASQPQEAAHVPAGTSPPRAPPPSYAPEPPVRAAAGDDLRTSEGEPPRKVVRREQRADEDGEGGGGGANLRSSARLQKQVLNMSGGLARLDATSLVRDTTVRVAGHQRVKVRVARPSAPQPDAGGATAADRRGRLQHILVRMQRNAVSGSKVAIAEGGTSASGATYGLDAELQGAARGATASTPLGKGAAGGAAYGLDAELQGDEAGALEASGEEGLGGTRGRSRDVSAVERELEDARGRQAAALRAIDEDIDARANRLIHQIESGTFGLEAELEAATDTTHSGGAGKGGTGDFGLGAGMDAAAAPADGNFGLDADLAAPDVQGTSDAEPAKGNAADERGGDGSFGLDSELVAVSQGVPGGAVSQTGEGEGGASQGPDEPSGFAAAAGPPPTPSADPQGAAAAPVADPQGAAAAVLAAESAAEAQAAAQIEALEAALAREDPFEVLGLILETEPGKFNSMWASQVKSSDLIDRSDLAKLCGRLHPRIRPQDLHYLQLMMDVGGGDILSKAYVLKAVQDSRAAGRAARAPRHAGVDEVVRGAGAYIAANRARAQKCFRSLETDGSASLGRVKQLRVLQELQPQLKSRHLRYLVAHLHVAEPMYGIGRNGRLTFSDMEKALRPRADLDGLQKAAAAARAAEAEASAAAWREAAPGGAATPGDDDSARSRVAEAQQLGEEAAAMRASRQGPADVSEVAPAAPAPEALKVDVDPVADAGEDDAAAVDYGDVGVGEDSDVDIAPDDLGDGSVLEGEGVTTPPGSDAASSPAAAPPPALLPAAPPAEGARGGGEPVPGSPPVAPAPPSPPRTPATGDPALLPQTPDGALSGTTTSGSTRVPMEPVLLTRSPGQGGEVRQPPHAAAAAMTMEPGHVERAAIASFPALGAAPGDVQGIPGPHVYLGGAQRQPEALPIDAAWSAVGPTTPDGGVFLHVKDISPCDLDPVPGIAGSPGTGGSVDSLAAQLASSTRWSSAAMLGVVESAAEARQPFEARRRMAPVTRQLQASAGSFERALAVAASQDALRAESRAKMDLIAAQEQNRRSAASRQSRVAKMLGGIAEAIQDVENMAASLEGDVIESRGIMAQIERERTESTGRYLALVLDQAEKLEGEILGEEYASDASRGLVTQLEAALPGAASSEGTEAAEEAAEEAEKARRGAPSPGKKAAGRGARSPGRGGVPSPQRSPLRAGQGSTSPGRPRGSQSPGSSRRVHWQAP